MNHQQETNSTRIVRQYNTGVESPVTKVVTSSNNPEDMLRSFLIDEIYRMRKVGEELDKKYPELLGHDRKTA